MDNVDGTPTAAPHRPERRGNIVVTKRTRNIQPFQSTPAPFHTGGRGRGRGCPPGDRLGASFYPSPSNRDPLRRHEAAGPTSTTSGGVTATSGTAPQSGAADAPPPGGASVSSTDSNSASLPQQNQNNFPRPQQQGQPSQPGPQGAGRGAAAYPSAGIQTSSIGAGGTPMPMQVSPPNQGNPKPQPAVGASSVPPTSTGIQTRPVRAPHQRPPPPRSQDFQIPPSNDGGGSMRMPPPTEPLSQPRLTSSEEHINYHYHRQHHHQQQHQQPQQQHNHRRSTMGAGIADNLPHGGGRQGAPRIADGPSMHPAGGREDSPPPRGGGGPQEFAEGGAQAGLFRAASESAQSPAGMIASIGSTSSQSSLWGNQSLANMDERSSLDHSASDIAFGTAGGYGVGRAQRTRKVLAIIDPATDRPINLPDAVDGGQPAPAKQGTSAPISAAAVGTAPSATQPEEPSTSLSGIPSTLTAPVDAPIAGGPVAMPAGGAGGPSGQSAVAATVSPHLREEPPAAVTGVSPASQPHPTPARRPAAQQQPQTAAYPAPSARQPQQSGFETQQQTLPSVGGGTAAPPVRQKTPPNGPGGSQNSAIATDPPLVAGTAIRHGTATVRQPPAGQGGAVLQKGGGASGSVGDAHHSMGVSRHTAPPGVSDHQQSTGNPPQGGGGDPSRKMNKQPQHQQQPLQQPQHQQQPLQQPQHPQIHGGRGGGYVHSGGAPPPGGTPATGAGGSRRMSQHPPTQQQEQLQEQHSRGPPAGSGGPYMPSQGEQMPPGSRPAGRGGGYQRQERGTGGHGAPSPTGGMQGGGRRSGGGNNMAGQQSAIGPNAGGGIMTMGQPPPPPPSSGRAGDRGGPWGAQMDGQSGGQQGSSYMITSPARGPRMSHQEHPSSGGGSGKPAAMGDGMAGGDGGMSGVHHSGRDGGAQQPQVPAGLLPDGAEVADATAVGRPAAASVDASVTHGNAAGLGGMAPPPQGAVHQQPTGSGAPPSAAGGGGYLPPPQQQHPNILHAAPQQGGMMMMQPPTLSSPRAIAQQATPGTLAAPHLAAPHFIHAGPYGYTAVPHSAVAAAAAARGSPAMMPQMAGQPIAAQQLHAAAAANAMFPMPQLQQTQHPQILHYPLHGGGLAITTAMPAGLPMSSGDLSKQPGVDPRMAAPSHMGAAGVGGGVVARPRVGQVPVARPGPVQQQQQQQQMLYRQQQQQLHAPPRPMLMPLNAGGGRDDIGAQQQHPDGTRMTAVDPRMVNVFRSPHDALYDQQLQALEASAAEARWAVFGQQHQQRMQHDEEQRRLHLHQQQVFAGGIPAAFLPPGGGPPHTLLKPGGGPPELVMLMGGGHPQHLLAGPKAPHALPMMMQQQPASQLLTPPQQRLGSPWPTATVAAGPQSSAQRDGSCSPTPYVHEDDASGTTGSPDRNASWKLRARPLEESSAKRSRAASSTKIAKATPQATSTETLSVVADAAPTVLSSPGISSDATSAGQSQSAATESPAAPPPPAAKSATQSASLSSNPPAPGVRPAVAAATHSPLVAPSSPVPPPPAGSAVRRSPRGISPRLSPPLSPGPTVAALIPQPPPPAVPLSPGLHPPPPTTGRVSQLPGSPLLPPAAVAAEAASAVPPPLSPPLQPANLSTTPQHSGDALAGDRSTELQSVSAATRSAPPGAACSVLDAAASESSKLRSGITSLSPEVPRVDARPLSGGGGTDLGTPQSRDAAAAAPVYSIRQLVAYRKILNIVGRNIKPRYPVYSMTREQSYKNLHARDGLMSKQGNRSNEWGHLRSDDIDIRRDRHRNDYSGGGFDGDGFMRGGRGPQSRMGGGRRSSPRRYDAKPKRLAAKAGVSGHERLQREWRSLLNKVSVENFQKVADELGGLLRQISTHGEIAAIARETFMKAVMEPNFSSMYADIVVVECGKWIHFVEEWPNKEDCPSFYRAFVDVCQDEYDNIQKFFDTGGPAEGEEEADREANLRVQKIRSRGSMNFIAELFQRKMIVSKILDSVLAQMLIPEDEELPGPYAVELVVQLITHVGYEAAHRPSNTLNLERFLARLKELQGRKDVYDSRTRFMIQDLFDLKKHGWEKRVFNEAPTTRAEIRQKYMMQSQTGGQIAAVQKGMKARVGVRGDKPYSNFVQKWEQYLHRMRAKKKKGHHAAEHAKADEEERSVPGSGGLQHDTVDPNSSTTTGKPVTELSPPERRQRSSEDEHESEERGQQQATDSVPATVTTEAEGEGEVALQTPDDGDGLLNFDDEEIVPEWSNEAKQIIHFFQEEQDREKFTEDWSKLNYNETENVREARALIDKAAWNNKSHLAEAFAYICLAGFVPTAQAVQIISSNLGKVDDFSMDNPSVVTNFGKLLALLFTENWAASDDQPSAIRKLSFADIMLPESSQVLSKTLKRFLTTVEAELRDTKDVSLDEPAILAKLREAYSLALGWKTDKLSDHDFFVQMIAECLPECQEAESVAKALKLENFGLPEEALVAAFKDTKERSKSAEEY